MKHWHRLVLLLFWCDLSLWTFLMLSDAFWTSSWEKDNVDSRSPCKRLDWATQKSIQPHLGTPANSKYTPKINCWLFWPHPRPAICSQPCLQEHQMHVPRDGREFDTRDAAVDRACWWEFPHWGFAHFKYPVKGRKKTIQGRHVKTLKSIQKHFGTPTNWKETATMNYWLSWTHPRPVKKSHGTLDTSVIK